MVLGGGGELRAQRKSRASPNLVGWGPAILRPQGSGQVAPAQSPCPVAVGSMLQPGGAGIRICGRACRGQKPSGLGLGRGCACVRPRGWWQPSPKPPPQSSLWRPRWRGLAPSPPRNLARCTRLTSARAPGSCHAVRPASSRHGEPGMGAGEAGMRPRCWPGRQGPAAPRAPAWPAPSAAPGEALPGGKGSAAPSLPPGRLRQCPDK